MTLLTITHNFETAHRLPQIGGKCASLHGHSWWARLTIKGRPAPGSGIVVDFAVIKRAFRDWIDDYLDHGVMLGAADPLVAPLREAGTKVYRFGAADPTTAEEHAGLLEWPTVELVARTLFSVGESVLHSVLPTTTDPYDVRPRVVSVRIAETASNMAEYAPERAA